MKQLLLFIFCLLVALPMSAQNYERQWKKVQQAVSDDQPRTVVMESQRLYDMAEQHNNLSQMLRAYLTFMQYRNEISADSFAIDKAHLVRWQQQTENKVDRSLLSFVLAVNEAELAKSYAYFCQSLGIETTDEAQIVLELAKTPSTNYIPLVKQGTDSKVFQHDMLSFLRMMTREHVSYKLRDKLLPLIYQRDEAFYREKGQIDAAVRVALEGWDSGYSSYHSLDEMIRQYGEVDDLVIQRAIEQSVDNKEKEVLEELRGLISRYPKHRLISRVYDKIDQIILPNLYAFSINRSVYPGGLLEWKMESSNVQKVEMRWYRLPERSPMSTAYLATEPQELKQLKKSATLVSSYPFTLTDKSFVRRTDTLHINVPVATGYYLIEMVPTQCDEYPAEKAETKISIVNVTRLKPLVSPVNNKHREIWALDSKSGHAIGGVQVRYLKQKGDTFTTLFQKETNSKGFAVVDEWSQDNDWNRREYLQLIKGTDMTLLPIPFQDFYVEKEQSEPRIIANLFIDRYLYRPGQDVHFSVLAYSRLDDNLQVVPDKELTVSLHGPGSRKPISEIKVKTDDFGVATGSFTLPENGKTGTYELNYTNGSGRSFEVEEYKRPTFEVVWQPLDAEYAIGDTITVSGRAVNYSGTPVSSAQVAIKKTSRVMHWHEVKWQESLLADTLYTDNEGRFSFQLILNAPQTEQWGEMGCFIRFLLNAVVTSTAGESHEVEQLIVVSPNRFNLSVEHSEIECKESLADWTISLNNSAGKPLDRLVNMSIRSKATKQVVWEGQVSSGKDVKIDAFRSLPSGNYVATVGYDSVKVDHPVKLISLKDKKPVEDTPLWAYVKDEKFKVGDSLTVQYGTSLADAFLLVNIYNTKERLYHEEKILSDELHLWQIPYQKVWGESLKLVFTLLRDGNVHQKEINVKLAEPDKSLQTEWTSFRDFLLPGQQETWTLKITKNGLPVSANLMATLYDESLDALKYGGWYFRLFFPRSYIDFRPIYSNARFSYSIPFERMYNKEWVMPEFDHWADDFTPVVGDRYRFYAGKRLMSRMASKTLTVENAVVSEGALYDWDESDGEDEHSSPLFIFDDEVTMELRTNFQETAFFMPMLRTDKNGIATIQFTLPESLTRWRMKGFAHTKELDYTLFQKSATARKPMMVQPQLPRFLRIGDKATFVATVQNLTDTALKGTLYLEVTDSTLNTVVLKKNLAFDVPANGSRVLSFPYQVKDLGPSVICKFYAKAGNFTDGEQHLLPILSDKVWLTESRAVYLNDEKKQIDLSGMLHGGEWWNASSTMTVEAIHNPLWVALESLEALRKPCTNSAVDLASAYYATAINKMLVEKYPSLAEEKGFQGEDVAGETWLKQLQELQCADGGFSWFKGMTSSPYITRMVVEPFVRLHVLGVPYLDKNRYELLIGKAMAYLDAQALETFRQMQKWEKENKRKLSLSENILHYLYIHSLLPHGLGKEGREALDFFMERLPMGLNNSNLYDKALACMVFTKNGKMKDAGKQMQSLLEYTVYYDELGRYYDTRRSMVSWRNYRMPVQTLLMEALSLTNKESLKVDPDKPAMATARIRRELSQWLLNQRRTQLWENSSTVMDALYALLLAPESELAVTNSDKMYTKSVVSANLSPVMPKEWVIRRDSEQSDSPMSWVSVSMNTLVPLETVQSDNAHSGLKVRRMYYVESMENGELHYQPANLSELKVGQKIISRITLSADRDFDFVEIRSNRASCMEPVRQLSGYRWYGKIGAYFSAKDTESIFYVDRLPKGEYELSEELFVTHQGTYQVGLTEAAGVYCPEFSDHTESMTVTVKD